MRISLLDVLVSSLFGLLVVACGENAATEPIPVQPEIAPVVAPTEQITESIYNEDGELLASEQTVNGLVLPKGLTPDLQEDTRRTFTTEATLEELRAYLGPRLDTGNVQQVGMGTMYRRAAARSAQGEIVRMDVILLPLAKDRVRLDLRDLPVPSENPPSQRELVEQAKRAATYWD